MPSQLQRQKRKVSGSKRHYASSDVISGRGFIDRSSGSVSKDKAFKLYFLKLVDEMIFAVAGAQRASEHINVEGFLRSLAQEGLPDVAAVCFQTIVSWLLDN